MAYDQDNGRPCLKCGSKCPDGFVKHSFRMRCTQCHCAYYDHDIFDFTNQSICDELDLNDTPVYEKYMNAQNLAKEMGLIWLPIGVKSEEVKLFLNSLSNTELPSSGQIADYIRSQRFRKQIPLQDRKPFITIEELSCHVNDDNIKLNLKTELYEAKQFTKTRNSHDFGIGFVEHMNENDGQPCADCLQTIHFDDFCVRIKPEHCLIEEETSNTSTVNPIPAWHLNCFRCTTCKEYLVDYIYACLNKKAYCLRHYGQVIRPRCVTCDHLIFSDEYTRVMDQEHHTSHFACHSCDASLTGQRYILRDDEPHCLDCYEAKFANTCEQCKEKIGCDSKGMLNSEIGITSLVRDALEPVRNAIYTSSSPSLSSQQPNVKFQSNYSMPYIYGPGYYNIGQAWQCDTIKDLSFKERHWHEKCFKCSACTTSLADRPFATKEEQLYCSDCYDERFAARCDGCQGVFKAGMRKYEYRGQQWHEECFLCVECKQPIGTKSFIPRENQVVCVPCYEAKYAQRCTKCSDVIRRGGVTYKGNPWHKECFTCTNCAKQLAGLKFTSKDEQPYCADCYGELFAKKCTKCTKPITGFGGCKFISFEDRHWHSECFLCGKCNCNLVGRGFLTSDEMIMCSECGR
ncbi:unnamed protein product [Schistosoma turkestanicum]|nr:unnamed protein product [Schistosoma turkestanicum]